MMKRSALTYLLFICFTWAAYGQTKYKNPPFDGQEAWLREISPEEMALGPLVINQDWMQRDSLTYLRFVDEQQTIMLYGTDSIPEWISNFKNLKFLCAMPSAHIKAIPQQIGNIPQLENLVLLESRLSEIPKSFKKLNNLKHLNLVGDGKCAFPNDIANLDSVESIFLANFSKIPEEIFAIKSLKRLYLFRNNITSIPESIKNLVNLEELNLEGNPIYELPSVVFELPKLANISVDKDNIKDERFKEKLKEELKGNQGVQRERLRKLQDIERKKIFEKMRDQEESKRKLRKHIKAYYEDEK